MKKFFKKSLIYALVFGMLAPTWLIGGLLNAQKTEAAGDSPFSAIYNFAASETDVPSATDLTFSPFSRNVVTPYSPPVSGLFNSKNWATAALIDRTRYISYTVFASNGYSIDANALKFSERGSATVADKFLVSYYVDGSDIPNDLSEGSVYYNSDATKLNAENYILNVSGARQIEFRFYIYGSVQASGPDTPTSTGTWRIDNVELDGSTVAIPDVTPPTVSVIMSQPYYNPDNWNANNANSIAGNVSDDSSGVASVAVKIADTTNNKYWSGSAWAATDSGDTIAATLSADNTSWSYPLAAANLTLNDSYSITASALDVAGNKGISAVPVSFYYGIPAPKISSQLSIDQNNEIWLTVSGNGEPNANITYAITDLSSVPQIPQITVAGGTVSSSGVVNDKFDVSALASGTYTLSAFLINKDCNYNYQSPIATSAFNLSKVVANTPTTIGDLAKPVFISVPSDLSGTLDLSGQEVVNQDKTATVAFSGGVEIQKNLGTGSADILIPAGTTMTAASGWDGKINLPSIVTNYSATLSTDVGEITQNPVAYQIGSETASLTFNQPVRLTFSGLAGEKIGFIKNSIFTEVTQTCDSATAPTTFSATGECKINSADGKDLVVWTNHYTVFITYGQVKVMAPTFVDSNFLVAKVEKTDGSYIDVAWEVTGADGYDTFINNVVVSPTSILSDHSAEYKVAYGTSNVVVKAYKKDGSGNKIYSTNTATKSVEFAQPSTSATVFTTTLAATVGPEPAQAAPAATTTPVAPSTTGQSSVIKGADTESSSTSDQVNWTPWIILFVLIILAGAATGGYFYWFAGKEEIEEATKPIKKATAQKIVKSAVRAPKKSNKKARRW